MTSKIKYILPVVLLIMTVSAMAQDGLVRTYYENRHMESAIYYAKDVIHGTARWFYENGVLKEEKNYSMGKLNGWIKTYYDNSAPKEELFIKDGRRDGIAKFFYKNGGLKTYLVYAEGMLKEKKDYAYDNTLPEPASTGKTNDFLMKGAVAATTIEPNRGGDVIADKLDKLSQKQSQGQQGPDNEYLAVVEEYPKPNGGLEAIQSKVVIPSNVKERLKGIVVIRAFIDDHGYVTKTEIAKGLGPGYDDAATSAVKQTTFQPGRQDGKPVNVQITIPVSF